jgi:hypothetical protein
VSATCSRSCSPARAWYFWCVQAELYQFAAWRPEAGEPSARGLVLDRDQAELLQGLNEEKHGASSGGRTAAATRARQGHSGLNFFRRLLGLSERHEATDERSRQVESLLESGLIYTGCCPRCNHWMSWSIPFGVCVDWADLPEIVRGELASSSGVPKEPSGPVLMRKIRRNDEPFQPEAVPEPTVAGPEASQNAGAQPTHPIVPTLTLVCACGCAHSGRPESAAFSGCGAAWNQKMTGNSDESWRGDWQLWTATPSEAEWAAHIKQDLSGPPLARIRATANQWRNGVTALTTVLTAVAILSGTVNASKLSPVDKWLAFGLSVLGFASLLWGTREVLTASIAVSGYDHRLLAPHDVRRYEMERARQAVDQIVLTQILVLVGVGLIAAAGFVVFVNPG